MTDFDKIQIKNLKFEEALQLAQKLHIFVPSNADLEYLRSQLRLIKQLVSDPESIIQRKSEAASYLLKGQLIPPEYRHQFPDLVTLQDFLTTNLERLREPKSTSVRSISQFAQTANSTSQSSEHTPNTHAKQPFFSPPTFSANIKEDVVQFFCEYERAANVNGWNDELKLRFLPLYLQNSALHFFDCIQQNNPVNFTFELAKTLFKTHFISNSDNDMLELTLLTKKQLPNESPFSYMADILFLANQVNPDMTEQKKCKIILRGLLPSILDKISLLDNSSVSLLRNNIQKYVQSQALLDFRCSTSVSPNFQHSDQPSGVHINAVYHQNSFPDLTSDKQQSRIYPSCNFNSNRQFHYPRQENCYPPQRFDNSNYEHHKTIPQHNQRINNSFSRQKKPQKAFHNLNSNHKAPHSNNSRYPVSQGNSDFKQNKSSQNSHYYSEKKKYPSNNPHSQQTSRSFNKTKLCLICKKPGHSLQSCPFNSFPKNV